MPSSLQAETRPNVHLNSRIEPIEPLHCARRVIARRYPPLSNAPTVEVRFARDPLLEGAGFEPSVPARNVRSRSLPVRPQAVSQARGP